MATLAEIRSLCDRVVERLASEPADHHTLLDTATVLMYISRELNRAVAEDAAEHAAVGEAPALENAMARVNDALQQVQEHRDDASNADIRATLDGAIHSALDVLALLQQR